MKKKYITPAIITEKFFANEYVSACYKIKCTTPNGNSSYYYIYADSNGNGEWDKDDKQIYSNFWGFSGCNEWHKGVIQDSAPTANGFVTTSSTPGWGSSASVYYWYENLGSDADVHVMTPGTENYQTNPNAS